MYIYLVRRIPILVLLLTCLFAAQLNVAFADHSAEEGETSHATTVHAHDDEQEATVTVTPIYTASIDVGKIQKMQQLLKALQELVVLLEKKAALEKAEHTHDNEDAHHHE